MECRNGFAIECRNLTARYGSLTALSGLFLSVCRGECFGLLGPNGAGKTTAMEIFEGLQKPADGMVEILGRSWGKGEASDRDLRRRIGVTLQETFFPEKLTVKETLELFRSFYPEGRRVGDLLELLDLTRKQSAKVGTLSGGQR
ncbi:MAG: ATP-binding cassette domain-containing protein, partial [Thermodesulfobacteriota bacterium]